MKSAIGHIQIYINPSNIPFYKDLLAFLGWETFMEGDGLLGMGDKNQSSLWFMGAPKEVHHDYDGFGVNHIAIHTDTIEDVDAVAAYLLERGVEHLFDTPQHRPEFAIPDTTYYQVMFKSPDNSLFEVVYMGPHS